MKIQCPQCKQSVPGDMAGHLKKMIFMFIALFVFIVPLSAEEIQHTTTNETSKKDESSKHESLDTLYHIYQPYFVNIETYEPVYFLVGTDPSKSKFQISLKYRIINTSGEFIKKHPWIRGFHLAYTQTSFWDLVSDSAPFEDTSYKPEFFFLSRDIFFTTNRVFGLFLQTGLQHESNGQAEEYSRSTNTAYIKPMLFCYNEPYKIGFQLSLKTWGYFNNDNKTNPDIADCRGFFELGLRLGWAGLLVIDNTCRWAKEGGSYKVDATYPLSKYIFNHVDMFFYLQYVNYLAEQILNYQDRTEALRLGLAIVR